MSPAGVNECVTRAPSAIRTMVMVVSVHAANEAPSAAIDAPRAAPTNCASVAPCAARSTASMPSVVRRSKRLPSSLAARCERGSLPVRFTSVHMSEPMYGVRTA